MTEEERIIFDKLQKNFAPFETKYKDFFVGIQTSYDTIYIMPLVENID